MVAPAYCVTTYVYAVISLCEMALLAHTFLDLREKAYLSNSFNIFSDKKKKKKFVWNDLYN